MQKTFQEINATNKIDSKAIYYFSEYLIRTLQISVQQDML